jgi:hypothetical protein
MQCGFVPFEVEVPTGKQHLPDSKLGFGCLWYLDGRASWFLDDRHVQHDTATCAAAHEANRLGYLLMCGSGLLGVQLLG